MGAFGLTIKELCTLALQLPERNKLPHPFKDKAAGHDWVQGPQSQNKFVDMLATATKKKIVDEIKEAKIYTVMADTTPDVSHQDQLSLCIRYVDNTGKPKERLLEIRPITNKSGLAVVKKINQILLENELDNKFVVFQSYDYTNSMSGKHGGAQRKLSEIIGRDIPYIPCQAHRMNTFIEHSCNASVLIANLFNDLESLYSFFRAKKDITDDLDLEKLVSSYHPTDSEQSEVEDEFENDDTENRLLERILQHTNCHLNKLRDNYSQPQDIRATDMAKIEALFGLLYMAGVKKAQHLNTKNLGTSDGSGVESMRSIMSRERFLLPLRVFRFHNFEDNLAAIRDVLDGQLFLIYLCSQNIAGQNFAVVGTVGKSKKEIPPSFLFTNRRPLSSSVFGFTKNETMISYKEKPNKIIYKANIGNMYQKEEYLKTLALSLMKGYLIVRSSIPNLPYKMRMSPKRIAGAKEEAIPEKRLCAFCPRDSLLLASSTGHQPSAVEKTDLPKKALRHTLQTMLLEDNVDDDSSHDTEVQQNTRLARGDVDIGTEVTVEEVLGAIATIKTRENWVEIRHTKYVILKAIDPIIADYLARLIHVCLTSEYFPNIKKLVD
ncbi:hypothetical protein ILUMI_03745 [Ignelater luminosus]|uniref:DUF4371 domain-containing protein n=1 Tax=Ignelater luminosus TaxID=2038154 RepID=A0A8K0GLV7_IGNLU|nr:hypothetical protein ILUMI_03745 [Ignelater luminosus]